MIVESPDDWSFAKKFFGAWPRPTNRVVNTQLNLSLAEELFDQVDFARAVAWYLYLAPAEFDASLNTDKQGLFALVAIAAWDARRDPTLGAIDEHAGELASLSILQELSAKRIRTVLI